MRKVELSIAGALLAVCTFPPLANAQGFVSGGGYEDFGVALDRQAETMGRLRDQHDAQSAWTNMINTYSGVMENVLPSEVQFRHTLSTETNLNRGSNQTGENQTAYPNSGFLGFGGYPGGVFPGSGLSSGIPSGLPAGYLTPSTTTNAFHNAVNFGNASNTSTTSTSNTSSLGNADMDDFFHHDYNQDNNDEFSHPHGMGHSFNHGGGGRGR